MNSPRLNLPYIAQSQAQKEITHNDALNLLDVTTQTSVIAIDFTPPGSPANGDLYIIGGDTATGAWEGQENLLTGYYDGWIFVTPQQGWRAFNQADGTTYIFDGADWVAEAPGAWQVPSLNLDWEVLGGDWQNPRYRIDQSGLVTIEGAMQNLTASNDGVIFTLPSGFRPDKDLIFCGYSAGGLSRWNIHAGGDVEVAASNMFFTSLSGIQFYAAS